MSCDFYILGSKHSRPNSARTIFCDGSADQTFREDRDIELSHWTPNCTAAIYRADTSTEICLNFATRNERHDFDLAINNHIDVDGILSVFSVVNPETALAHRETLVDAAAMGDFENWGGDSAQLLFQSVTVLIEDIEEQGMDLYEGYSRAFETVHAVLSGAAPEDSRIRTGLEAIRRSVSLIESGQIKRRQLSERFTHYSIPAELGSPGTGQDASRLHEGPSVSRVLSPHARAKFDAERVQLVSAACEGGWQYDLCYPGYMWADTETLWRAPGFEFAVAPNGHYIRYEPLDRAVKELAGGEGAAGEWMIPGMLSPFESIPGRNSSVVMTFAGADSRPSTTPPDRVEALLLDAYPD